MSDVSDEFVLDGEQQWLDIEERRLARLADGYDPCEYGEFETRPVEMPRVEPL